MKRDNSHASFLSLAVFYFETIRIPRESVHGGAEIAEGVESISEIRDEDPMIWAFAWAKQARHTSALVTHALADGNKLEACQALL